MNTKLENKLTPNPHTPTPWRFDGDWHRIPTIFGADGKKVASVEKDMREATPERAANAAFIVEAANNHAALVTALQDVLWACHHVEKWHSHINATFADDSEWTESAKYFKEKREAAREALDRLTLRTELGHRNGNERVHLRPQA